MIDALPLLLGPEGYQISRSVRLRSSASAYFNRTPASAGNRRTFTWSSWVKRGNLSSVQHLFREDSENSLIRFQSTNSILIYSNSTNLETSAVYRDASAWYHVVVSVDTTQATASNRVKLYVNGMQVTSFSTATYPAQNYQFGFNSTVAHAIGTSPSLLNEFFDGYLTEINFIDGQALTPSSFGETNPVTGVWQPKKYTGTYGTNGFYLNFSDNSAATAAAIGKDYSGNGNNWTPNNISLTAGATYDSMIDVPTMYADGGNGRGNYAVLSPIDTSGTAGSITAGNLNLTGGSAAWYQSRSGFGMTSGKWYWEVTILSANTVSNGIDIGIANSAAQTAGFGSANRWTYNNNTGGTGRKSLNGTVSSYGTMYVANDVVGVAFDADAGTLAFYVNNSSQGIAASSGLPNPAFPIVECYGTDSVAFNFGQRPFAFSPPSGFKALNTLNLPTPTIPNGRKFFDVALQTGNTTGRTVSGLAFQPDLVIVKNRAGSTNRRWGVIDSVRGVNKTLSTALTDAEVTSQTDLLTTFNSDGFTIGADAGLYGWNGFAESYAHFTWKEGATQGFDIVTGTSTGTTGTLTLAHSLGVAPAMVIAKNRNAADDWYTWHTSLGASSAGNAIRLNTTAAKFTSTGIWGTGFTSSNLLFGQTNWFTASGQGIVAYAFSEVAGFSKFGSLSANASADNAFAFTCFLPRFVMLKRTDSTSNWIIWDTARNTYNVLGAELYPNLSNAESTVVDLDLLSNGFKLRNASFTGTWIYAAFASVPFKYSLAF